MQVTYEASLTITPEIPSELAAIHAILLPRFVDSVVVKDDVLGEIRISLSKDNVEV